MKSKETKLLLHVPVLHSGYIELVQKYSHEACGVMVFGKSLTERFPEVLKQLPRLSPEIACKSLQAIFPLLEITVLEDFELAQLQAGWSLVFSDDYVSRAIREKYFAHQSARIESAFLQWDQGNVLSRDVAEYDCLISASEFDKQIIALARQQSRRSSDWWRHVGAALVKDRRLLRLAYNEHLPSEHIAYAENDPRCVLPPGEQPELTLALHAEQAVLGWACKNGVSTDQASLYTTTFPCPSCARLIIQCGIKEVYFESGHSNLHTDKLLKGLGIRLVKVES